MDVHDVVAVEVDRLGVHVDCKGDRSTQSRFDEQRVPAATQALQFERAAELGILCLLAMTIQATTV